MPQLSKLPQVLFYLFSYLSFLRRMKVLVCGGAGYIGSHVVREMVRSSQHKVVVLDLLAATHGHKSHIETGVPLEVGDVRDEAFLERVFSEHKPDAVIHMCAWLSVPESVREPLAYFDNNVVGTLRVLQAMKNHGCKQIVFSSTAALFGTPESTPIKPDARKAPESPYGDTKFAAELMINACETAYGIRGVHLRYFNACGAHVDGDIGETHDPETHLIPLVLQVALGQRDHIKIFGTDYATPDGTCVRDYVHVTDLSTAHIQALDYLEKGGKTDAFNLGLADGFSVKEVIESCRKVTGHPIPAVLAPRREGDPPILVASGEKAKSILGWKPQFDTIEKIIETAWKFHVSHPKGYKC